MNSLKHVAIIMDGNGRWGFKKKKSRNYGHLKGLETVEKILTKTVDLKIPYLTLFTFSTENWKRPNSEINFLFSQLKKYFEKHLTELIKRDIKISVIGEKSNLPNKIKNIIKRVESLTINNKKIHVMMALNYGAKEEILKAIKKLIKKRAKINLKNFQRELYTYGIPDPDILIRTGGKKRLSNFLLWQSAYAEIFFVNKLWPEFSIKDYKKIINKFYNIKRNFGSI